MPNHSVVISEQQRYKILENMSNNSGARGTENQQIFTLLIIHHLKRTSKSLQRVSRATVKGFCRPTRSRIFAPNF